MEQHQINILIQKSKENDNQAFGLLVEQYQQMLFRLAFRLLADEEEAKDTVQESFVKAWLAISSYHGGSKFSTWLYKITWNCCYDKLRKHSTGYITEAEELAGSLHRLSSGEDMESELINRDLKQLILSFTQELTPKQKLVFVLRDIEELEIEEIEEITKLSAAKIKSNLYLARKQIRNKIRETEKNERI